jgi:hypothetical protein
MFASEVLCHSKVGRETLWKFRVEDPQPCAKAEKANCGDQVGNTNKARAAELPALYKPVQTGQEGLLKPQKVGEM